MRGFKMLAVAAAGALAAGGTLAQSPADFYKDRQVTILHGFGVGGTYGKTSLSLAEALKPILGTDSIIVQNRTGSGGLKMTNYAYNVAPKDGSVLLMLPDTLVVTQLTRPRRRRSTRRTSSPFSAGPSRSIRCWSCAATPASKTWSDLRNKEVPMASSGVGSQTYQVPGDRQRPAGHQDEDRQGLSRLAQDAAGDGAGRSLGYQPDLARLQDQPRRPGSRTVSRCR